jgi:N-acetylglucosamine-1-phosphate transferase, gamma subunit
MVKNFLILIILFCVELVIIVHTIEIPSSYTPVRIIEEPAPPPIQSRISTQNNLKPKYKPAQFSGPFHLEVLNGECFKFVDLVYTWNVCPFQNVTQHERTVRWQSYNGIIGIWWQWNIENGKFISMSMMNGDDCGDNYGSRKCKIYFNCNKNETKVVSIVEKVTCDYIIEMDTHLVCDENNENEFRSMNVYNYLNSSFQREWNLAFTELNNGLITEKMYNQSLANILEKSHLIRSEKDLEILRIDRIDDQQGQMITNSMKNQELEDIKKQLEKCQKENEELKLKLKNKS